MRAMASGLIALVVLLAGALWWVAQMAPSGPVAIDNPRIRLTPGDGPMAGYLTIRNLRDSAIVLTGAAAPDFERVMMHQTVIRDGQSRMLHRDRVVIAPGEQVEFRPGGLHLMLMGRKRPLSVGDQVDVALQFDGLEPGRWPVRFTVVPVATQ